MNAVETTHSNCLLQKYCGKQEEHPLIQRYSLCCLLGINPAIPENRLQFCSCGRDVDLPTLIRECRLLRKDIRPMLIRKSFPSLRKTHSSPMRNSERNILHHLGFPLFNLPKRFTLVRPGCGKCLTTDAHSPS